MRVSVVINTYNRAAQLRDALASLSRQTHDALEVVVVDGPSTDGTDTLLANWSGDLKVETCPVANLSVSRNIGLRAASGEVVAFLDDDAVAHRQWIEALALAYNDPAVQGAGGFTIDHTGFGFQSRYTLCDRLANAVGTSVVDPGPRLGTPGAFLYPSLLGTNCSFRRDALLRIGGFDEAFAYMYEETDVCLRIQDAGGRIVTVPEALVFHRYAPSHLRTPDRVPRSLFTQARSKAHFCFKHRRLTGDVADVAQELRRFRKELETSTRELLERRLLTITQFAALRREVEVGLSEGMSSGAVARSARSRPMLTLQHPFLPLRRLVPQGGMLRIALVSQGYPPTDTAGIARWTHELACALAALGHEVHVIAATSKEDHLDYKDGVWIHRVRAIAAIGVMNPVPLPEIQARRAAAVHAELLRTADLWGLDIVSMPIWDAEGLTAAANLSIPVVTSLHTTYGLMLEHKPTWREDADFFRHHVQPMLDAEAWLFQHSMGIIANSEEVVRSIEANAGIVFDRQRVLVIPHGMSDLPERQDTGTPARDTVGEPLRVLYVGRIERRKGLDVALKAMIELLAEGHDLEFDVVGQSTTGDPAFRASVQGLLDQAQVRGFAERIHLHGAVSDERLLRFYANCDLFVAPSRYESFGLVLLEAMRAGKPVVAARVGGMPEVVRDSENGLLFVSEDTDDLARCLRSLVGNATLRKELGQASRAAFLDRFTDDAMASAMIKAYRMVLSRAQRPKTEEVAYDHSS